MKDRRLGNKGWGEGRWRACHPVPRLHQCSPLLLLPHTSLQARNAAARGDFDGARHSGRIANGLNFAAVVFYVISVAVAIGLGVILRAYGTTCYSSKCR